MTNSENQGWDTRGEYFVEKRRKLTIQQSMWDKETSLFAGMSFYIDGYTNPSFQDLKRMIVSNGGIVEHYYYDTLKINVVIAQNLAEARASHFKKMGHPPQILKPNWILDCIEQKRLLPKSQYKVEEMRPINQSFLSFSATGLRTQSVSSSILPPPPPQRNEIRKNDQNQQLRKKRNQGQRFSVPRSVSGFARPAPRPYPPPSIPPTNSTNDPTQQKKVIRPSVKRYFQKSRLHFLSSTKHLLKQKYNRRSKKHDVNVSQYLSSTRFTAKRRIIVHIDIDCFFASVAMKNRPELHEKPVGVTSTTNIVLMKKSNKSTSDIASCNYVARKFGIRNGMWVKTAKRLCPDLLLVPYDFEGYRKTSEGFYDILSSYKKEIPNISVMSVDECLLDMTFSPPPKFQFSSASASSSSSFTTQPSLNVHDVSQTRSITFGEVLRFLKVVKKRIWEELGIHVSCGIGDSILTARLACSKAKPSGICIMKEEDVDDFLHAEEKKFRIRDFPGIGWSNERKMILEIQKKRKKTRIRKRMVDEDDEEEEDGEKEFYASDLLQFSEDELQGVLGMVKGGQVYQFLRGVDDREINYERKRKSISVDLNYGLRLENDQMIEFWEYLDEICEELSNRMKKEGIKGRKMTLKILKRRSKKETSKFLGTGWCDSFTKTKKFGQYADSQLTFFREAKLMFSEMRFRLEELRGIGLTMNDLQYDKSVFSGDDLDDEEEERRRRSPGKKQMRTITITQMMRSPKKDYSTRRQNIQLFSSSSNSNKKKKKKSRKRKREESNNLSQSKLSFFVEEEEEEEEVDGNKNMKKRKLMKDTNSNTSSSENLERVKKKMKSIITSSIEVEKTSDSILLILEEFIERRDLMNLTILAKYVRRICVFRNHTLLFDEVVRKLQSSFQRVFGNSTLVLE